jgi:hypothetical protein
MLEIICSGCGRRVQGDDAFSGKQVLCPVCGAAMTAPQASQQVPLPSAGKNTGSSDGSFRDGEPANPFPVRKEIIPHFAVRWGPVLIVAVIALVSVALVVPAILKARQGAHRTQSRNNLKEIGMAFLAFEGMNKRLPYNGTKAPYAVNNVMHGGPAIAGDNRTGSWAYMILPFLGEQSMFNEKRTDRGVAIYMCPGRGRTDHCTGMGGPGAWTDYFLNPFLNDPNGAFDVPDTKLKLTDIKDGASLTVLVGHGQIKPSDYASPDVIPGFTDVIFNGGSAGLCRPNKQVRNAPDSSDSVPGDWGGPFPQGVYQGSFMVMGDGHVVSFAYGQKEGTISNGKSDGRQHDHDYSWGAGLGAALTPNGSEPLSHSQ